MTEAELVQAARRDEGCIAELLHRYEPMLSKMAASFDALSHAECMQEGGIALMDAVMHFNPQRGTRFGTYAYVCVRNRLTRAQRAARAAHAGWQDMLETTFPTPGPEDMVLQQEALAETTASVRKQLSPFEYAVWRMRIDGYSYAEIAATLTNAHRHITTKSVNNALTRVRKKLRGTNG